MMCQFRLTPGSPICGQATHGEFCAYHQGVVGKIAHAAYRRDDETERVLFHDPQMTAMDGRWPRWDEPGVEGSIGYEQRPPETGGLCIEATVRERKPRRWLPFLVLAVMVVFSWKATLVFGGLFLFFAFVVMARNGQGRPVQSFQPSGRVVIPDLDQYREAS